MTGFERKPLPEQGDRYFNGVCYISRGVYDSLQPAEVYHLIDNLLADARAQDGLHGSQVFNAPDGREVWAIDDHTHWRLLLSKEF